MPSFHEADKLVGARLSCRCVPCLLLLTHHVARWLHSIWHLFSALAHGTWMYYVSETPPITGQKPNLRHAKSVSKRDIAAPGPQVGGTGSGSSALRRSARLSGGGASSQSKKPARRTGNALPEAAAGAGLGPSRSPGGRQ